MSNYALKILDQDILACGPCQACCMALGVHDPGQLKTLWRKISPRQACRASWTTRRIKMRRLEKREGVLFDGDWLPLAGVSVAKAKALLRDSGISYFSDAIVNNRPVMVSYVLRPGDRLVFCQRFGCKAGDDKPIEEAIGEAMVVAYSELLEMAQKVKAMNLPTDRSLDVMIGMVAEWAEQRFGPPDKNIMTILNEVVARLDRIEAPRVPYTQREIDIVQALGESRLTGEELAAKAGYEFDGYFKGILASMVKRGVICNKRPGYFLAGPKSGLSED
jgi:hypothetical protein